MFKEGYGAQGRSVDSEEIQHSHGVQPTLSPYGILRRPEMALSNLFVVPTPAMSTQRAWGKSADFCGFRVPEKRNEPGISGEHRRFSPQIHRTLPV